jgi:hypothetical protein
MISPTRRVSTNMSASLLVSKGPLYRLFSGGSGTSGILRQAPGPEFGYVSMHELRDLRGPLGLPIVRDLRFDAHKTLSPSAGEVRHHGRVAGEVPETDEWWGRLLSQ